MTFDELKTQLSEKYEVLPINGGIVFFIKFYKIEILHNYTLNQLNTACISAVQNGHTIVIRKLEEITLDKLLEEINEFLKRKEDRKLSRLKNIKNTLDYIKYELITRGIDYQENTTVNYKHRTENYITVIDSTPFKWFIGIENINEELLVLKLNRWAQGETFLLDANLENPENKVFEQIIAIINYFTSFQELANKYNWRAL